MHKPTFRVIQVLELLCAAGEPLRLSQISKTLEVPKSTLLPILQTMVENRYLSRDGAEKYCPGPGLLGVGAAAKAYHSPEDTIRECLEPMVAQFGETCYSGVFDGGYVRYVENVDSPFDFYFGLRNFIAEQDGRSIRKISQNDAYALLYQYMALAYPEKEEKFSTLMHEDYAKKQVRKPPRFKK